MSYKHKLFPHINTNCDVSSVQLPVSNNQISFHISKASYITYTQMGRILMDYDLLTQQ